MRSPRLIAARSRPLALAERTSRPVADSRAGRTFAQALASQTGVAGAVNSRSATRLNALTTTATPRLIAPGQGVDAGAGRGGAIVSAAREQLGSAYVFGAEEPGAFDCSGLTQWAVRQATGRTLPRVAADQAKVGEPVNRADLREGDLVFFANTYQAGISHVGIYAGDGKFVHAASERQGVIVTRMDDPYWSSHYASARRVS